MRRAIFLVRTHMSFRFLFMPRSRLFTPPWGIYTHIAYIKSSSRSKKKNKKSEHHHAMWLLYNACVHRDTTFLVFFFVLKSGRSSTTTTLVVAMTESADPSLFSLSIELHKHKLTSKSLALSTYTYIAWEESRDVSGAHSTKTMNGYFAVPSCITEIDMDILQGWLAFQ